MALSQSALSELLEAFRTGDGVDMIRESVRTVLQELVEFEAAGGALIGAQVPAHDQARFLGESLQRLECFRRLVLGADALDHTAAVADLRKQQLAAFAQVVEPAADFDGLAFVRRDIGDANDGRRGFQFIGHKRYFGISVLSFSLSVSQSVRSERLMD